MQYRILYACDSHVSVYLYIEISTLNELVSVFRQHVYFYVHSLICDNVSTILSLFEFYLFARTLSSHDFAWTSEYI